MDFFVVVGLSALIVTAVAIIQREDKDNVKEIKKVLPRSISSLSHNSFEQIAGKVCTFVQDLV